MSSNFSDFWQKIMTGLPKLPSTVSEIFKGEKLPHQKKFLPSVSDFELLIFRILAKKVANITKAAFYLSRLRFCQKNVSEKKKSTFSDFQGKNFGGRLSKKNFWGNKFCMKKVIRIIYWLCERKFQTFPKKFTAELSKQHSTYPDDEIQEKICF